MTKFIKRPIQVEATQWHKLGDHPAVVLADYQVDGCRETQKIAVINTSSGPLNVNPGDWILTDVKGEHWPISNENFQFTYQPMSPADETFQQQVEVGRERPGLDGTLWRLLGRANVDEINRWCIGERLRGTPPEMLFDALSIWLSSAVVAAAAHVGRTQMQPAARDILQNTAKLVHKDIEAIRQKKKEDALLRGSLRLVKP